MSGHVFISYSHQDRDYVEELADFLARAGVPVWFDHKGAHGDRIDQAVEEQIETCAAFLVVMSPASRESRWVMPELTWAMNAGKPIMPILIEGRPFLILVAHKYEDLPNGGMPGAKFVDDLRRYTEAPIEGPIGELVAEAKAHEGHVRSVAFPARNPSLVASAGPEPCVRVWETTSGELLLRLALTNVAWPVAFNADGTVVAAGGLDFSVHLWDTRTALCSGASASTLRASSPSRSRPMDRPWSLAAQTVLSGCGTFVPGS
jgi:TIR domain/WD domain, G-beta repeat